MQGHDVFLCGPRAAAAFPDGGLSKAGENSTNRKDSRAWEKKGQSTI